MGSSNTVLRMVGDAAGCGTWRTSTGPDRQFEKRARHKHKGDSERQLARKEKMPEKNSPHTSPPRRGRNKTMRLHATG